jgi:hypothetical protein
MPLPTMGRVIKFQIGGVSGKHGKRGEKEAVDLYRFCAEFKK